ncbi:2TM domain-containing protein [Flavobacterium taihuense]|uniref:2TM domain-containing protein n=1 Tax=Flavobacterium taihuense TaxID=2857508 RepID=A0ABS6XY82_9FLAO|nr:2TM domain-containing protein [Flavobacterium taihuense]MBW4360798.1 2TM domain-containing protein [Flavobacterium taihuense]
MGRYRKQLFENFQDENFNPDSRYEMAYKRVKRIKGFYVHALVYVFVNAFIIIFTFNKSEIGIEVFFKWETFFTAIFWGIGLLAHWISVFGRDLFFGADWEERKINEFMDDDKKQKWE